MTSTLVSSVGTINSASNDISGPTLCKHLGWRRMLYNHYGSLGKDWFVAPLGAQIDLRRLLDGFYRVASAGEKRRREKFLRCRACCTGIIEGGECK